MLDHFENRINRARDSLRKLESNSAPTIPIYDFGVLTGFNLVLDLSANPTHRFLAFLFNQTDVQDIASVIYEFGNTTSVERNPSSGATWSYNGSNTITADFVGIPSHEYRLQTDIGDASSSFDTSDGSGNVSISITDQGGLLVGDHFLAFVVESNPNGSYGTVAIGGPTGVVHANLFSFGTSSSGIPDPNQLIYDGNTTITAIIDNPISGNTYKLLATQSGGGYQSVSDIAP